MEVEHPPSTEAFLIFSPSLSSNKGPGPSFPSRSLDRGLWHLLPPGGALGSCLLVYLFLFWPDDICRSLIGRRPLGN